jgi:succinoglycan biosynthesis transport protein ExoP
MISSSQNYLKVVFKRIGLVLSIIALFVIIAAFNYFYSAKTYSTSITFSVQERAPADSRPAVMSFLRSRTMAERVSKTVGYWSADELLSMVKVQPGKTGRNVIVLSVEGKSPEKITETANAWVREFQKAAFDPRVEKGFSVSGVNVNEKAKVPREPAPAHARTLMYIVVFGIVLGIGVSFYLEYLDHTLRTANGVEFYGQMPFLGSIPPALKDDRESRDFNRIVHVKPETLMAEAFRNVKVSLLFASAGGEALKTMAFTSAEIVEGKTYVASNVAITFAGAGDSTLLIDADLRKGTLKNVYGVKPDKGLSSFLEGSCSLDEAIVQTSVPNLSLIPAGPFKPDPVSLLKGAKLDELMQTVKSRFKRVIIDAPSILGFDDMLSWAEKCDGMVYVIGAGFTPLEDLNSAKAKIGQRGMVVGAVLNTVAIQNDFFYYYSYAKFYLKNKLRPVKKNK